MRNLDHQERWDRHYMKEAYLSSELSKDNIKVGSCIVSADNIIISKGYNGLPRYVRDTEQRYGSNERNLFIIHAEVNAIYNACRSSTNLLHSTIYITHPPCPSCSGAIIQSGISRVVIDESSHLMMMEKPKHRDGWEISKQLFLESKINWQLI